MKYERAKWTSALLSLLGVSISLASSKLLEHKDTLVDHYLIATLAAGLFSAIGAAWAIWASRRLERERQPLRVFIAYARTDLEAAQQIAERLRAEGFDPWLDVEQLRAGTAWHEEVLLALQNSAAAVVLVSPGFTRKGFLQRELRTAMDTLAGRGRRSPVVPVILNHADIPDELRHIQAVDLSAPNAMAQLAEGLRAVVGREKTTA
ncbi:MAG: toll/interleukin-1 receptor domain-containing protein [Acidobacteriaceae bacterium]|nr:toll/interleukin-1 receptor domain-containing protein [Acidobacteriaceae bacterium]